jgi:hypothetical protein
MYAFEVGRVQLYLRKDGTGVVVWTTVPFEARGPRLPLDAEDIQNATRARSALGFACLVLLGGSGLCLAGAVWLLVVGWVVVGIALAVAGLVLLAIGLIFLGGWTHFGRGQFVVLDSSQLEQFRLSFEAERQALGVDAKVAEIDRAQERLWKLAGRLSSGEEPESPKSRAAPWLRGRRQGQPRARK